jgi:hypothetical protein
MTSALRGALAVASIAALGSLGACNSTPPSIQTGEDAETIMDGRLARVDNSRSALAYVDPNVDYSRFTKVWIYPLDLDNVEIVQPSASSSVANRFNREWELTDSDRTRLQSQFQESIAQAISSGGTFTIAEEGGKDVLRIDAMITRLAPTASRDDVSSRGARSTVITQGAGSMSIAMVLSDGYSGEVLAIIKDTRSSGSTNNWSINNSVSNMAEVRRIFNSWGTRLHDGLLALQARPVEP